MEFASLSQSLMIFVMQKLCMSQESVRIMTETSNLDIFWTFHGCAPYPGQWLPYPDQWWAYPDHWLPYPDHWPPYPGQGFLGFFNDLYFHHFLFFWSFPTIDAFTQLIADYTWLALPFDGWIVQPSTGTSRWSATSFTCASNLMQGWVRMVSTSHWCATVNNLSWKFEMALYLTRLFFLHMPHTSSAKVTLVFSWINGWFHDRCLPVNSASKGNFGLKLPSSMRSRKKDSNSAKLAWDHW